MGFIKDINNLSKKILKNYGVWFQISLALA